MLTRLGSDGRMVGMEKLPSSKRVELAWIPITGTPDYQAGDYVAVYVSTHGSGHATYWVFSKTLPKSHRTISNALAVGGLPTSLRVWS